MFYTNIFTHNFMKLLIQRVAKAEVRVEGQAVGQISQGFLVLCGFKKGDSIDNIARMAEKCLNLRVFEDIEEKMNLSLLDIKGELLAVSQFTLYADCRKGRRPGFDNSMLPEQAKQYYELFVEELKKSHLKVEKGIFGAKMKIKLVNDGPVTIMLDSDDLSKH